MDVRVSLPAETVASLVASPPASILVRPDGAARPYSMIPFAFGDAARDGLALCWRRLAEGWNDPRLQGWAEGFHDEDLHREGLVPNRDPDVDLSPAGAGGATAGPTTPRLPAAAPAPAMDAPAARSHVRALALSRRYVLGPVRSGPRGDCRIVRVSDRRSVVRVNRAAGLLMDGCARPASAGALADRLAAAYPSVAHGRIEDDTLLALRDLAERGVMRPALAPQGVRTSGIGATAVPGLADV
jgi:hypothetical protein